MWVDFGFCWFLWGIGKLIYMDICFIYMYMYIEKNICIVERDFRVIYVIWNLDSMYEIKVMLMIMFLIMNLCKYIFKRERDVKVINCNLILWDIFYEMKLILVSFV